MQYTRTVIIIILIFYLVSLGFLLNAIGKDININYDSTGKDIKSGFIINIITSIKDLPIWLNMLFILIPVGLLTWLIVLTLIPTIDAGS